MKTMRELSNVELDQVNGSTGRECFDMMLVLGARGYGTFLKVNEGRSDLYDLEGMQACLASKGYSGTMYVDDVNMNIFTGPDGLPYGNDYVVYLLETGQI